MSRLQAIDIGTNSVRSIVVEVPVGGARHVIDDEKAMTRLGQGLDATGMLDPEAIDRTIEALKAMRDIGRSLGVSDVRAIATEAVRRASNGEEFVDRAARRGRHRRRGHLGGGGGPARLAQRRRAGGRGAVLGGGRHRRRVGRDRAGRRRRAGRDRVAAARRPRARRAVRRPRTRSPTRRSSGSSATCAARLRDGVDLLTAGVSPLVGSGGAVTTIAAVVAGMRGRRYESLHGIEIERAEVMQLLGILSHSDAAERLKLPGMPAERVDVVLPGTLVLAEVMKLFGASSVLVNARGIREGIVIDTLASEGAIAHEGRPPAGRARPRRALPLRPRARRAGHAPRALALRPARGARCTSIRTGARCSQAAAMLHDVGYYVAYDRHHKHSYHLILHANLPPFTRREMAMVASIARYHTKSLPKRAHESWATLDPPDRLTVRSLAAILRIADGLDRGRGGPRRARGRASMTAPRRA